MTTDTITALRFTDRHLAKIASAFGSESIIDAAPPTSTPLASIMDALRPRVTALQNLPLNLLSESTQQRFGALGRKATALSQIIDDAQAEPMIMMQTVPDQPPLPALNAMINTVPVNAHHHASLHQCVTQLSDLIEQSRQELRAHVAPHHFALPDADVYYVVKTPLLGEAVQALLGTTGRPALTVTTPPKGGTLNLQSADKQTQTLHAPPPSDDHDAWDRLLDAQLQSGQWPSALTWPAPSVPDTTPRAQLDHLPSLVQLAPKVKHGTTFALALTPGTVVTVRTPQGLRSQPFHTLDPQQDHLLVGDARQGNFQVAHSGITLPGEAVTAHQQHHGAGLVVAQAEGRWIAHHPLTTQQLASLPALPDAPAKGIKQTKINGFVADLDPSKGYLHRKYDGPALHAVMAEHHVGSAYESGIHALNTVLEQTHSRVFASLDVKTDPSQHDRPYYISLTLHSLQQGQLNSRNVALYLNATPEGPIVPTPHILQQSGLSETQFNAISRPSIQFDDIFKRAWNGATRNGPGIIAAPNIQRTLASLAPTLPAFTAALSQARPVSTMPWMKRHNVASLPSTTVSVTLADGSKPTFDTMPEGEMGLTRLLDEACDTPVYSRDLRFKAERAPGENTMTFTDTLGGRGAQSMTSQELAFQIRKSTKQPNYNQAAGHTQALLQHQIAHALADTQPLPPRQHPDFQTPAFSDTAWASELQPYAHQAAPASALAGYTQQLSDEYDFALSAEENIERLARAHPGIDQPVLSFQKGDTNHTGRQLFAQLKACDPALYEHALAGLNIRDEDIDNVAKTLPSGSGKITLRPWLRAHAKQIRLANPAHQAQAVRAVVARRVVAQLDVGKATIPNDVAERLAETAGMAPQTVRDMYQQAYQLRDKHGNNPEGLLPTPITGTMAWDGGQAVHDMLWLAHSERTFGEQFAPRLLEHALDIHIARTVDTVLPTALRHPAGATPLVCESLTNHGSVVEIYADTVPTEALPAFRQALNAALPALFVQRSLSALPERPLGIAPEQEQQAVEQLSTLSQQAHNQHAFSALDDLCAQHGVGRLRVSQDAAFCQTWLTSALHKLAGMDTGNLPTNKSLNAERLGALGRIALAEHERMVSLGLCPAADQPKVQIKGWLSHANQEFKVVQHCRKVARHLQQDGVLHIIDHPIPVDTRPLEALQQQGVPVYPQRYTDTLHALLNGVPDKHPMRALLKTRQGQYERPRTNNPLARLAFDEFSEHTRRTPLPHSSPRINMLYQSLPHKSQNAFKSVWDSPQLSTALDLPKQQAVPPAPDPAFEYTNSQQKH
jgi:hypothetical protein